MRTDYLKNCPIMEKCEITYNKVLLPIADAVVFHASDLVEVKRWPQKSFKTQKFTLMSMESALNVQKPMELLPMDFIDWAMTPLSQSDVNFPYGGYWVNPKKAKELGFPPVDLPSDADAILHKMAPPKIPAAFWLVSNCETHSKRELAIKKLGEHFRVDIAGECAKIDAMKKLCPKSDNCANEKAKYYFLLISENTVCRDYITEKYWNNYALPIVPIVMRRYVYELRLPPKSFIAFDDYPNAKMMAQHLSALVANETEYLSYFAWRSDGWATAPWNAKGYRIGYCDLCEKLLTNRSATASPNAYGPDGTYHDFKQWYLDASECETEQFVNEWITK